MEYYIGMSLAANSTIDTGVAVIDETGKIILVDKLYKVSDIQHFFDNYSSCPISNICVSLPWDNSLLNGKWRILSKPYQMVSSNKNFLNTDNWTNRYSTRACEYLRELSQKCLTLNRFELYLTRQSLHLNSCYKERSPADCKFLQSILKIEHGMDELPTNMMPMGQLEAIVGAMLAKETCQNPDRRQKLFNFEGLSVINTK